MKLQLKPRIVISHPVDNYGKHYESQSTYYDCTNPQDLCEHLVYNDANHDSLYFTYYDESGFSLGDDAYYAENIHYCPYCGEKIEYEIVS